MFAFNQPARLIHWQTTTTLALLALIVGIASNCASQEQAAQSDPEIVKQICVKDFSAFVNHQSVSTRECMKESAPAAKLPSQQSG